MKTSTEQDYKRRILRVLIFIQNHLDEAVSLDELAALANFSPFHFHRVFTGMVGESVMEYVRRLRLERAACDLKNTRRGVTAIAFDAGYETLDAFIRAFKVLFGVTPTAFRRSAQLPVAPSPVAGLHYDPDGEVTDFDPINTGGSAMKVEVRSIPKMKVAFVRGIGPYSQSAGAAWGKLCSWAGPRGLIGPKTRFVGLSHDDPEVTAAEKIRYDACIILDRDITPEGDIGVQEIGGGSYAVTVHEGPYETMSKTYSRMCGEWIPKNGYRFLPGPSLEIYLNEPGSTPPDKLQTEIHVAVERE